MRLADLLDPQNKAPLAAKAANTANLPPGLAELAGLARPSIKITQAAAEAVKGQSGHITAATLLSKLAPEDFTDLEACSDPLPFLRSFAIACVWTAFRRQGIAPPTWTEAAHCDKCGPVYLWAPIKVTGCPWCWNRLHGVNIPRPEHYEINERNEIRPLPTPEDAA